MVKRKELTVKEKVDLINSSNGKSQRQLAEQFGIGKTQVYKCTFIYLCLLLKLFFEN